MKAADYVHEYVDGYGRRWYVVAEHRDGRYYAPQRADVVKLTGAHTIFGPLDYVLSNAYHYRRHADAVRRAGELYNLASAA
jgi:hypothetical protein